MPGRGRKVQPAPAEASAVPAAADAAAADATVCQWCSASVPAAAVTCPSCGASLREAGDAEVLGVTQVDLGAISRAARARPGRLAALLGAEQPSVPAELAGRIEPPSDEVRQEMLRLRLAAIDAELEAQVASAEAQRDLLADGDGASGASESDPG